MHAISHRLPHRGPTATRARARWQPYSSVTLPNSLPTPSRSPTIPYLPTPASSVTSSPPTVNINPPSDAERCKLLPSLRPLRVESARDAQKARYVTRLIDQAVRSLCEIWRPEDIPSVFKIPMRNVQDDHSQVQQDGRSPIATSTNIPGGNAQLPSPVSPSTGSSPFPPILDSRVVVCQTAEDFRSAHVVPIKGFVHEVLRRSRMSASVLQTALCYLEAVRPKIPDVLREEKSKVSDANGRHTEVQSQTSVMRAEQHEPLNEIGTTQSDSDMSDSNVHLSDTVRIADLVDVSTVSSSSTLSSEQRAHQPRDSAARPPSPSLPPLPPLPSPLLCPRRTFLACLILASKFLQDRSYSNRAWAKLAGLPPREIGRCERALGEALQWRLWVGKNLNVGWTASNGRAVARTRSDGDLLSRSCLPVPLATNVPERSNSWVAPLPSTPAQMPRGLSYSSLRRSTTMPNLDSTAVPPFAGQDGPPVPRVFVEAEADFNANVGSVNVTFGQFFASPMPTPSLSYSPMSTSSTLSDGPDERTVQMSTTVEVMSPTPHQVAPIVERWRYAGDAHVASAKTLTIFGAGFSGGGGDITYVGLSP